MEVKSSKGFAEKEAPHTVEEIKIERTPEHSFYEELTNMG